MKRSSRLRSARGRERLAKVLRSSKVLVTPGDVVNALQVDRTEAAKLLSRWTEQGWLKRLRRGLYSALPLDAVSPEQPLEDPWILVPQLFAPAYVGGWSAAEHWDLTEQTFREICVFTTRRVRNARQDVGGTVLVLNRIAPEHMFGTKTVWHGQLRVAVSDPARTIIDMLARPPVGGGIHHVDQCLRSYLTSKDCDLAKLIEYGDRLRIGSVFKRLGFLIERSATLDDEVLSACAKRLTSGNSKLDPALPARRLVKRWRLWVPEGWKLARND